MYGIDLSIPNYEVEKCYGIFLNRGHLVVLNKWHLNNCRRTMSYFTIFFKFYLARPLFEITVSIHRLVPIDLI